jgi:hypothetical protein
VHPKFGQWPIKVRCRCCSAPSMQRMRAVNYRCLAAMNAAAKRGQHQTVAGYSHSTAPRRVTLRLPRIREGRLLVRSSRQAMASPGLMVRRDFERTTCASVSRNPPVTPAGALRAGAACGRAKPSGPTRKFLHPARASLDFQAGRRDLRRCPTSLCCGDD